MNDYREVRLDMTPCSEDATDLMAAFLADAGFESFVPDATGLTAYVPEGLYDADAVRAVVDSFPMPCTVTVRDLEFEENAVYAIVGSQEANPMEARISDDSPFGKAMLGKHIGDIVEVDAPAGLIKFEILAVER